MRIAVASRSFSRHPVLRAELLERYPNVTFNDGGKSLNGASLIDFLKGHERVITALERLDHTTLSALPELRVVSKYGVGLDMIDLNSLVRHGIRLGWSGGVNRRSVAELVIGFAITLLRHVPQAHTELQTGGWRPVVGRELSGRVVGIVGCGHVGKELIHLLSGFGCKILVHDIRDYPEFYRANGIEAVNLDTLLDRAEIVSLHIPLNDSTRNLLDRARLQRLRPDAILINAARGGIVDEAALQVCLEERRITGAAFDVFSTEPPENLGLLKLPNFLTTPHIGGSTEESILAMGRAAIRGLDENKVPAPGDPCWDAR